MIKPPRSQRIVVWVRNTRRKSPIWISSPLASLAESTGRRLTRVPLRLPRQRDRQQHQRDHEQHDRDVPQRVRLPRRNRCHAGAVRMVRETGIRPGPRRHRTAPRRPPRRDRPLHPRPGPHRPRHPPQHNAAAPRRRTKLLAVGEWRWLRHWYFTQSYCIAVVFSYPVSASPRLAIPSFATNIAQQYLRRPHAPGSRQSP